MHHHPFRPFVHAAIILAAAVGTARADDPSAAADRSDSRRIDVIPKPQQLQAGSASYALKANTPIVCDAAAQQVAEYFAGQIEAWVGARPKIQPLADQESRSGIILTTRGADAGLGAEGYALDITSNGIRISAPSAHGLFYGVQTLRQMRDGVAKPSDQAEGSVPLQHVRIVDQPGYRWRGMHLDVCRHFMPLEFVKKFIDLLAYHKMNVFHWHLTEDQGWRIEIKKFPKLTELSAWRTVDGVRHGGFYTQDEIRELLAYAQERFVTVLPEIEMPGHALAALAAYPQLSCTGGPFEITGKPGVYEDVLCPGNEETFAFVEGVLSEVCALFPNVYVHIGGDECPKKRWQQCPKCQARKQAEGLADEHALQSYFMHRVEKFLSARGKRMVGWDEILEGGLAPNATVMSWRGTKGGIEAAQQGHDVVMCPSTHCYFDFRQSDRADERGADWGPPVDLARVYSFNPTPPELNAEQARHVLGAQGNVWTERMNGPADVEYMVFPRACALAEVLWTAPERRAWDDFAQRMEIHYRRLAALHVNFRQPDGP